MASSSSSSSNPELLKAHVELWNLTYSYLKSMALQCAVELGIPNAIHRAGGAASLPEILAAVPVPEHRKPHLPRLMRFLAVTGVLALDDAPSIAAAAAGADSSRVYRLTPLSRLLVDDARVNGCTSLAPFVLSQTTRFHVGAALHLSDWFKGGDGDAEAEMPFRMAHGTDPWDAMRRDPVVSKMFHDGLGADSKLALDFVVTQCAVVFDGVGKLIDVGGGNGSSARAIARAFPHVKCSVLDLPHVIRDIQQPSDDGVEYIVGDMMSSIPPTDAVLLKYILHDWNDEDCVKILKQCRKAICYENKPSGGKVIIIDTVVESPANDAFEAQVTADVLMMVMTSGKERDKHEWCKIFMEAGFKNYNKRPVLGFLSIIELYP